MGEMFNRLSGPEQQAVMWSAERWLRDAEKVKNPLAVKNPDQYRADMAESLSRNPQVVEGIVREYEATKALEARHHIGEKPGRKK